MATIGDRRLARHAGTYDAATEMNATTPIESANGTQVTSRMSRARASNTTLPHQRHRSDGHADRRHPEAAANHHPHQIATYRAQRHARAQFDRSLTNSIGDDAVDAERRHEQCPQPEEGHHERADPFELQRVLDDVRHQPLVVNGECPIDVLHGTSNVGKNSIGGERRAHDEKHGIDRDQRSQQIELGFRHLVQAVIANVSDHANHLKPIPVRPVQPSRRANRIPIRPIPIDGRLVDDGNRTSSLVSASVRNLPARSGMPIAGRKPGVTKRKETRRPSSPGGRPST